METKITKIDNFGRGIGYSNGKIVFVENTLPGDEINLEIKYENRKYAEGVASSFIKKSETHIKSDCPFFEKCGGCQLRHMSYEFENNYKLDKTKDILTKFGKIDPNVVGEIVFFENENYYRNKVVLKANNKVGFYEKKSNNLVEIDNCLLLDDNMNSYIELFNQLDLSKIKDIIIRKSEFTKEIMVVISGEVDIESLNEIIAKASSVIVNNEVISGNGYITEKLGEFVFKISPNSFFQVNTKGAEVLYNEVLKALDETDKNIVDLYCGTGTIGIYVSKNRDNIYGIEINEEAVMDARFNAESNGIVNAEFKIGDANSLKTDLTFKPDAIIVDPPRVGLGKYVIEALLETEAPKIIYVSCDPTTLARDIYLLSEKYNVTSVTPVNMFPRTYHVENVVKLEIKKERDE